MHFPYIPILFDLKRYSVVWASLTTNSITIQTLEIDHLRISGVEGDFAEEYGLLSQDNQDISNSQQSGISI